MRALARVSVFIVALSQIGAGQQVPEGIHQNAVGPAEMCGLTGENASDLVENARKSSILFAVPIESDRFELFANENQTYQLVATLPSEAAYPAVSCRYTYDEAGSIRMRRSMRCDAGRTECDALFIEFQELDAELTRDLRGKN